MAKKNARVRGGRSLPTYPKSNRGERGLPNSTKSTLMRVLTETRERAVPPVYEKHFGYSLPGWKWEDDCFLMMI